KRGAVQSRYVGPNFLASAHQRVGEMAISLRVTRKQFTIELQGRGRIEEIEAILLQDWLEQHYPPAPFALFHKEGEAPGTDHMAQHAVDCDPIRDRLLRLSDGAFALQVDGSAAKEMQEADAFVVASLARLDKFLETSLDPRGDHPPFFVPQLSKAIPPAGVAQQRPVLNDFAYRLSFQQLLSARLVPSPLDRNTPMRKLEVA